MELWGSGPLLAFLFGVSFSLPGTGVRRSFPARIGYFSVPLESVFAMCPVRDLRKQT